MDSHCGHSLRVGVGVNVSNVNPPHKCAKHICGEDFLPIWLETSVCDGADKVTKLIKQKEKAITRVHKKARKDKTSYEIVQTQ